MQWQIPIEIMPGLSDAPVNPDRNTPVNPGRHGGATEYPPVKMMPGLCNALETSIHIASKANKKAYKSTRQGTLLVTCSTHLRSVCNMVMNLLM